MSNLILRTISGIVLASLVIFGVLYLNNYLFSIAIAFIAGITGWEVANLLKKKAERINLLHFSVVSFISSISLLFFSVYFSILIIFIYAFYVANKHWDLKYLGYISFGLVYSVVFVSSIGILFNIDRYLLFILFATVWAGDTFAYFVGKSFGKHKLAPKLSPKKTWEGAFGSVLGSLIFGGIFSYYFGHVEALVPVFFASIIMQAGDLFESFIKRQVNVKDSSHLIPGHGGILDRIDSLIFASVVFLTYYQIF